MKKVYSAEEMCILYSETPNKWLLLEVLEHNKNGRAQLLRLLKYATDKDDLYEYLMEDENWTWDKNYIFVFSDPNKECVLDS